MVHELDQFEFNLDELNKDVRIEVNNDVDGSGNLSDVGICYAFNERRGDKRTKALQPSPPYLKPTKPKISESVAGAGDKKSSPTTATPPTTPTTPPNPVVSTASPEEVADGMSVTPRVSRRLAFRKTEQLKQC